ncbi:hypothetical protein SLEP1_g38558 [Rubroshorea leprosula]|nr:hypothetical protein SLEP1_g38558 [Rubroshorea leprosula]
MNVVGRQMARSSATAHHHWQYSDDFLDATFNAKWLQFMNFPSSQDFGYYGGVQGSRVRRKSPDSELPPVSSRSCSLRKNGDEHI